MSSEVIDDEMDVIVLDETDKKSLTQKLEDLYVTLIDEDISKKQSESTITVLWESVVAITRTGTQNICSVLSGKYNKNDETIMDTLSTAGEIDHEIQFENNNKHSSSSNNNKQNEFQHCASEFTHQSMSPAVVGDLEHRNEREEECTIPKKGNYGMVIDGVTLGMVLENDIKYLFMAVARQCRSVICCRCSPAQKASVVRLITQPTLMWAPSGSITLAIGDGANDVPMIQAANVGVGISGKEGRQAVLSSDYAIGQFRFLKRLLLVHGNYSYKRVSKLILFSFMKNMALSLSNFWFAIQTMYSGLLMYFGILFTLYNALFTTIPIVFIAMYNQDVPPSVLMQYPTLYLNGLNSRSFNWLSFFGWCVLGVWHAYIIFIVAFASDGYFHNYLLSADDPDLYTFGIESFGLWANGVTAYTYLVCASTMQVALLTTNWTRANIVVTVSTLLFYFGFIWFFCNLYFWTETELYETEVAVGIVDKLFSSYSFWLGLLISAVAAILPNYILKAGRVLFYPEPSHLMREWSKQPVDDIQMEENPRRLVRRNTGFAFSQAPPSNTGTPAIGSTVRSGQRQKT